MKIEREEQLIEHQLYMRHVIVGRGVCGEGCILRWEGEEDGLILDHHSCKNDRNCAVDCICDTFRVNCGVWYETYPLVNECEITGHPMVVGEL